MEAKNSEAARGTAVLALSQFCFFVLGYLAVLVLAWRFGPALYGTYGVIISILVWMEEAGRYAVSSGAAKLIAEGKTERGELETSSVALNLGLHVFLFIILLLAAPWLASWFGIANGAFLIRLAAVDLPLFGIYSAYRAIHQGHRNFLRLGIAHVVYAVTKLAGVLLLTVIGLSLESALIVNIAATVAGVALLIPGVVLQWKSRWRDHMRPLIATAAPIGLYYFLLGLRASLVLWVLQMMSPASEQVMVGVFVAALNIARAPSMILMTVTTVILPSISRAIAAGDEGLAKLYINQAFRFGFIFYVPVCLVLMTDPEKLLQWLFSRDFSGGGLILSLLVAAEGLRVFHAILGAVMNAAGEGRKAALIIGVSLIPSVILLVILIRFWGAQGAALGSLLTVLLSTMALSAGVQQRFGALMLRRCAYNIAASAILMFTVYVFLSAMNINFILPYAGGLAVYLASLLVSREISPADFAAVWPLKIKLPNVSSS